MDARSAAHVLEQVAALLALHGEPAATAKPFTTGARRFSVEGQQGGDLFEHVGGAASIHGD